MKADIFTALKVRASFPCIQVYIPQKFKVFLTQLLCFFVCLFSLLPNIFVAIAFTSLNEVFFNNFIF